MVVSRIPFSARRPGKVFAHAPTPHDYARFRGWSPHFRKHAIDHRAGLPQIAGRVAPALEVLPRGMLADFGMLREQVHERTAAADRLAAEVVHEVVRILAPDL